MIQLSDHFEYKRLLQFAFPSVIMMVFTSIYSVVDGFFVSNFVGKTPFAAVNFIMPVLMILGCLSGLVMVKNKILGSILVTVSIFVMVAVTVFMILSVETKVLVYLLDSKWAWLWTTLPKVMIVVLVAGAAGGEFLIWRVIQRYVVR